LILQPDADRHIEVVAISIHGCENTDDKNIQVLLTPEALFEVFPYEGCSPLPVTVTNLSQNAMPVTFQWLVNGTLMSTLPEAEVLLETPGSYDFTLVVLADNGCSASQSVEGLVTVFGQPEAFFTATPSHPDILNTEVAFFNQSTDFEMSEWTINAAVVSSETSLVYSFPDWEDLTYEVCVEVSNAHDCRSIYCKELIIEGVPAVYVPNAFTSDGDGKNDFFIPVMTGMSDSGYELTIYNRWGQKIFQTTDPKMAWVGNAFEGDFYVQNQVYTWVLKCREQKSGLNRVFNGFVGVIR